MNLLLQFLSAKQKSNQVISECQSRHKHNVLTILACFFFCHFVKKSLKVNPKTKCSLKRLNKAYIPSLCIVKSYSKVPGLTFGLFIYYLDLATLQRTAFEAQKLLASFSRLCKCSKNTPISFVSRYEEMLLLLVVVMVMLLLLLLLLLLLMFLLFYYLYLMLKLLNFVVAILLLFQFTLLSRSN